MDNFIWDKRRITLLLGLLFLLLSLPIAILLVQQRQPYTGRAVNPPSPPISLHITNVHARGFTVSWVTSQATTGRVRFYGTNPSSAGVVVDDVRTGVVSTTHYVSILDGVSGVSIPSTTATYYYFRILSGDTGVLGLKVNIPEKETYLNSDIDSSQPGLAFRITTAPLVGDENNPHSNPPGAYSMEKPLLSGHPYYSYRYGSFVPCPNGTGGLTASSCFRPNPIFGEVRKPDGNLSAGSIVYLSLTDSSGNKKSRMLSALTESSGTPLGRWVIDMANFYTPEVPLSSSSRYAGYLPGTDKLKAEAEAGSGIGVVRIGLPIPQVIDASCITNATAILNCAVVPIPPSGVNPLLLPLVIISPTATVTPLPTVTTRPTVTPLQTVTPIPTNTPRPTTTPIPTATPTPIPTITPRPTNTVGPTPTGPTPTSSPLRIRRDVNQNGRVDTTDLNEVIKSPFPCALGTPVPPDTACNPLDARRDVNQNGRVDTTDLNEVIKSPFPCAIGVPVPPDSTCAP